jgi:hypothetical protein
MSRRLAGITAVVAVAGLWGAGPALAAGPTWNLQTTPHPASVTRQALEAVSCPSTTECVAVGYSGSGPLAEVRTTGAWVPMTVPNPGVNAGLDAVSCVTATDCTAFGAYDATSTSELQTLAEHWDGTSWTVQATPNPEPGATFTAGSCSSATSCVAVGGYPPPKATRPRSIVFAESWNGTSWTIQSTPNPPKSQEATLYGVSCPSATDCVAVGTAMYRLYHLEMVAERWNGTRWFLQSPPNLTAGSTLNAVSCPTAFRCMAVGSSGNQVIGEYWDGSSWTMQVMPAGTNNSLGVSCWRANDCTAVSIGGAQYWNGTSWVFQPTPNPGGGGDNWILDGVSCPSVTECTAVGDFNLTHRTDTLAVHR